MLDWQGRLREEAGPAGYEQFAFWNKRRGTVLACAHLRSTGPLALAVGMAAALGTTMARPAAADFYVQDNLVADTPGAAARTDPNLVNPWGIVAGPTTPFWTSNNHSGTSTIYQGNSKPAPLVVTVPAPPGSMDPGAPTGIVFNGGSGFEVAPGNPARFIFATEDGTISGWNPAADGTHAIIKVNNAPNAVYKGLGMAGSQLFAANFHDNSVDVFNSDWTPAGSFTDATVPAGFAPFNITNVQGRLLVTFAMQNGEKHDDVSGPGNGYVDVFDPSSHTFTRLISGGTAASPLNSPWGMTIVNGDFGQFAGDLLVGNFGDGKINAFDPTTGAFIGPLLRPSGDPIQIEGLWGLMGGVDPDERRHSLLYFTAGPGGEAHGLFGRIDVMTRRPRLRRYN
jgi:uncharacterized protein (TIGR03118 family)